MSCETNEVDYDKLATNVTIAAIGNILTVTAATELLRITVPPLPCPVYLEGQCVFQNATAGSSNLDAYLIVGPVTAGVLAAASAIDSMGEINIGGTTTEPPGRKLWVRYRLPADSPGDYMLAAWRETGSDTGTAISNGAVPCQLSARRA